MLKKGFLINISYALIICLLFLAAMNFEAKFYYYAFASTLFLLVVMRRIRINAISVVYLALGLLMAVYHSSQGVLATLRPFAYFCIYLVGFNLPRSNFARRDDNEEQDVAYQLLVVVALGSFAHLLLNFMLNMGQSMDRNTLDIWSGEIMSATGQAALGSLMIGLACALLLASKKKLSRFLALIALSGILIYNLTLSGRALILNVCVCFAIGGWFTMFQIGRSAKKQLCMLARVAIVAAVLIAIYAMNLGGLRTMVESSNLYNRFFGSENMGLTETGRWGKRLFFLRNMLEYPFGGLHMRAQVGYAHDLLLDAYDEFGVLSMLLLMAVLADGLIQLYRFCKNENHMLLYRVAALCVSLSIMMFFFLEPIFAGMPWLFVCYSLVNGALKCTNRAPTRQSEQG